MNYIPQLAKMFDVEIGERFDVVNRDAVYFPSCYFSDDDFVFSNASKNVAGYSNYDVLAHVLWGVWQIKKLPWKPKKGDTYFMPGIFGGIAVVEDAIWNEDEGDREVEELHYNNGLVCRTREEAMAKAKKMLEVAKCQHDKHC